MFKLGTRDAAFKLGTADVDQIYLGETALLDTGIQVGTRVAGPVVVGGTYQRFQQIVPAGTYVLQLGDERATWTRASGDFDFPSGIRINFFISGTLVFVRDRSRGSGLSLTIYNTA